MNSLRVAPSNSPVTEAEYEQRLQAALEDLHIREFNRKLADRVRVYRLAKSSPVFITNAPREDTSMPDWVAGFNWRLFVSFGMLAASWIMLLRMF